MARWTLWAALAGCAPEGGADPIEDGPGEPPVDACVEGLDAGQCAPDFTLADADGVEVSLAGHRGRPVLVVGSSMW
jgi:cytochrome oxidase Cu insertion factor (SCO1/SenC/PrrC family)